MMIASLPTPAATPPAFMLLPFVAMLLAIAVMPFISKHHWEHHYPKWAMGLGSISLAYYLFFNQNFTRLGHTAHEYVSFLALVG